MMNKGNCVPAVVACLTAAATVPYLAVQARSLLEKATPTLPKSVFPSSAFRERIRRFTCSIGLRAMIHEILSLSGVRMSGRSEGIHHAYGAILHS